MLRAVIFDMDDTLIDWSGREGEWIQHSRNCLQPIHEHLLNAGHPMPDLDWLVRVYSEQGRQLWEAVCAPEWLSPRQIDILGNTLKALNLEIEAINLEKLQRLYGWRVVPGVKAFHDTEQVLTALREAGLRVGMVTNADLPMWMRDSELQALGLLGYLDVRLTAGDIGRLKPHPAPFQEALRQLNVTADEAIFVGDRVQDDVAGAQSAGMRAVWVRRASSSWPPASDEAGSSKPNATIYQLSELLTTLDLWYPGWRTQYEAQGSPI